MTATITEEELVTIETRLPTMSESAMRGIIIPRLIAVVRARMEDESPRWMRRNELLDKRLDVIRLIAEGHGDHIVDAAAALVANRTCQIVTVATDSGVSLRCGRPVVGGPYAGTPFGAHCGVHVPKLETEHGTVYDQAAVDEFRKRYPVRS